MSENNDFDRAEIEMERDYCLDQDELRYRESQKEQKEHEKRKT